MYFISAYIVLLYFNTDWLFYAPVWRDYKVITGSFQSHHFIQRKTALLHYKVPQYYCLRAVVYWNILRRCGRC